MGDNTHFDKSKNQWVDAGDNPDQKFDPNMNQWMDTSVDKENITDGAQLTTPLKGRKKSTAGGD